MSEVQRKKKDNEAKDKKNQRMRSDNTADPRQNVDREGVHNEKRTGDQFDSTLEKNSKKTKPNDGKGAL